MEAKILVLLRTHISYSILSCAMSVPLGHCYEQWDQVIHIQETLQNCMNILTG